MKINNNHGVNFPEDNSLENNIRKRCKGFEVKSTEAKSVDALSSQGKAIINMSFKAHFDENAEPVFSLKQLSDDEFLEYKSNFIKNIKNFTKKYSFYCFR